MRERRCSLVGDGDRRKRDQSVSEPLYPGCFLEVVGAGTASKATERRNILIIGIILTYFVGTIPQRTYTRDGDWIIPVANKIVKMFFLTRWK